MGLKEDGTRSGNAAVRVELRLLAGAKARRTGPVSEGGTRHLDVAAGTTVERFLEMTGIDQKSALVVLLNGRYAAPEKVLCPGDVVSVFPPVAGG